MDDKDVIIDQLMRRIESLLEKIQNLEADNLELKERIARLEKNSATSSKPPSSDIVHPSIELPSKRKKRRRGGQQGHPKHARQPFPAEAIDETIVHQLSEEEVTRRQLVELPQAALALQQISLPKKLYRITEHRVQLYRTHDGRIISAILPPEIRKGGLFAPDMTALVGYLKGRCHASYSTLRAIFTDIFGLDIECGYLSKLCTKKVSAALEPMYGEVLEEIRRSPVVGSDETGHQNPAFKSAWTWCWQTPSSALFYNVPSRGSQVLKALLGEEFNGIIVCDFFSANKKFINDLGLQAQFCFAHLIRDMKFLTTLPQKIVASWSEALLRILRKIFKSWKLRHTADPGRYRRKIEKLQKAFLRRVRRSPWQTDALNIKTRFDDLGARRYFLFLERDDVPPTNNASEQAIRFVVIDRKVTMGTRSDAGMRFCERMWTLVAICARQKKSVIHFFRQAILSTYTGTPYPKLITGVLQNGHKPDKIYLRAG
jgi:transposase